MVPPDTELPTVVITGRNVIAKHLQGLPDDAPTWSEAWQLVSRHDAQASTSRINGRLYLVRIETDSGRQVLAQIHIDDLIVRDAAAAGLPQSLGHEGKVIALCGVDVTALQARWVLRMLARQATREVLPPHAHNVDEHMAWRMAADVLLDVLAVNPVLTATLR